jgi:hypothetical protein
MSAVHTSSFLSAQDIAHEYHLVMQSWRLPTDDNDQNWPDSLELVSHLPLLLSSLLATHSLLV